MYQITKKVLNIANNVISESIFANIDCSVGDLIYTIAPKLHNLAKSDNDNYSIHGKSFHTVFVIKQFPTYNIIELSNIIEINIKNNVRTINNRIKCLNEAVKESNKKKKINSNINKIELVKEKDYLITFDNISVVTNKDGDIEIK